MVKYLGGNYVIFIESGFWKSVLFSERLINISGFVNGPDYFGANVLQMFANMHIYEFDNIINFLIKKTNR